MQNAKSQTTKSKDIFTLKGMNLHYGDFHALKNINLALLKNEVSAFIGPSGCGKSSLLRCLNRMNDLVTDCQVSKCY